MCDTKCYNLLHIVFTYYNKKHSSDFNRKIRKKYLYLHRQYKSTLYESDTYIRQATSL